LFTAKVSSNADFSQPLGAVEKSRGAEYPPEINSTRFQTDSGAILFQI